MTLPTDFNDWEHFQSVLIRTQNRIVREEFNDVGADDWVPDISTSRGSLRVACTLKDNDTAVMTELRLFLYYYVLRKARDLVHPVYGSVIEGDGSRRKFKPQITLFFQEDFTDVELGYSPITGEISFRLMTETSQSLTESELRTYATKIKTLFTTGNGFVWQKGKEFCSYTDWEKGYQLQLLVRSKTEGRRIVEQVLDIQSHTPDWDKFNHQQNEAPSSAYPTNPGNQSILGRSRKKARKRPIADVRFQYALIKLDGLPNPIPLVDRSGIFLNPLERVL